MEKELQQAVARVEQAQTALEEESAGGLRTQLIQLCQTHWAALLQVQARLCSTHAACALPPLRVSSPFLRFRLAVLTTPFTLAS